MSEPLVERKHPDFLGLQLLDDPIGAGAQITRNIDLNKAAQLDKRQGYRRANQIRYSGGVAAIIDVQRICDYQKLLIVGGLLGPGEAPVFEHEGSGAVGGSGAVPFFNPNLPPIAVADAVPDEGVAPLNVAFSSLGSYDPEGGPLTFSWDFGDGSPPSTDPNPNHEYTQGGEFTAALTVTDQVGAQGVDTSKVTVTSPLIATVNGTAQFSLDGGRTWQASAGIPTTNIRRCVYVNGLALMFRSMVAADRIDVYRSADFGANYVLVGNIPSGGGRLTDAIVANNNRVLIPVAIVEPALQRNAIARSDTDGSTWTVSAALNALKLGGAWITHKGAGVCVATAGHAFGFGVMAIHVSNDNGATFGGDTGGPAGNASASRIATLSAGRIMVATNAGGGQGVYTSDADAPPWTLRDPNADTVFGDGNDAIAQTAVGRISADNAVTWGNLAAFPAGYTTAFKAGEGWYVAVNRDVHFSSILPTFALRGTALGAGNVMQLGAL